MATQKAYITIQTDELDLLTEVAILRDDGTTERITITEVHGSTMVSDKLTLMYNAVSDTEDEPERDAS